MILFEGVRGVLLVCFVFVFCFLLLLLLLFVCLFVCFFALFSFLCVCEILLPVNEINEKVYRALSSDSKSVKVYVILSNGPEPSICLF